MNTTPDKAQEWEKEFEVLKDELVAQATLKEKEKYLRKTTEEEKRRTKESLRKIQANNDRLKEERENLLQEKDKLQRMAETETERLKEEIRQ